MSFCRAVASSWGRALRGFARAERPPLEDLARLRRGAYRLLGAVFLHPDEGWVATLPQVAEELLAEGRPFDELAFWAQWERLLGALRDLGEADRPALEAEYVDGLTAPSGGEVGLVYESTYVPRGEVAWVLAELDREYAELGFSVAPAAKEPSDHAAVELDFMSLLCGKEEDAWVRGSPTEGVESLEREGRFLLRHLSRWFPELARRAASRNGDGFYALAAGAAQAFIAHDLDLVTALLEGFREGAKR